MKQVSLLLNLVLLVLVALLFYWHFRSGSPASGSQGPLPGPAGSGLRLAYVNMDSLQVHYGFFLKQKARLDSSQAAMEAELDHDAQALQNEANQFQAKAATMSQAAGEAEQKKLEEKQRQLQNRQENMRQLLIQEQSSFQGQLQAQIEGFLNRYNKGKHYSFIFSYLTANSDILLKDSSLDITPDVIRGLNAADIGN